MPEPRLLISIDYEPWIGFLNHLYAAAGPLTRKSLDDGYTRDALDPILQILGGRSITIFLAGEIVDWYPEVPQKIIAAGHELGFHSHLHRPLSTCAELRKDLAQSESWLKQYRVRGYRAPIVNMPQENYQALAQAGLSYSSSIYAPSGLITENTAIYEIPVSTWPYLNRKPRMWYPRNLSLKLLAQGEFPFGSGFSIGAFGKLLFPWIEKDLKAGNSPVLVIHNYQIVPPPGWPSIIRPALDRAPLDWAFVPTRRSFLEELLQRYPVGRIDSWLGDCLRENPR